MSETVMVSPTARVAALSSGLFIAAGALTVAGGDITRAAWATHWWVYIFVAVGFAIAERFVFHVEFKRDAVSFSMSEGFAALALAFLSPIGAIGVRVVVSVALIWFTWRPPVYKLFFNAGLFALQLAVAFNIVRLIADPASNDETRFLIAVAVALIVVTLLDSLLVLVAISIFEGDFRGRVRSAMRAGAIVSPINAMVATITVAPGLIRPELMFFAVIPMAAVWFILRQYGRLAQNHKDLKALHGFSAVVGRSLDLLDIGDAAVSEAAKLLRADRAALQVFDDGGQIVSTSDFGATFESLPTGRADSSWNRVFDTDRAVECGLDAQNRVTFDGRWRHTALAVAIRDADTVIGVLTVAERSGSVDNFGPAELSRAHTLAGQLATSIRRALLHADIEHGARHDKLTGELNRFGFEQALRNRAMWGESDFGAVMMLDLDRFKEVNDTLGHHVGDRVLVEFAKRIKGQLAPSDVLARFGGDEFAVLLRRSGLEEIEELAERIKTGSFTPVRLDELDVVVTTSIGIAPLMADAATVLRHADIAMYAAKREHTAIEVYRPEIDRRSPDRLSLLGGLRNALEHGSLEVHYQPKVDMVTSTVTGAEALVRWNHPTRGWISPIEFIQVAEESGLITRVTDQVLAAAIGTARRWVESGHDLGVAVNLSPHDLLDEQLPQRIGDLLQQFEFNAEKLTLEITESAFLADTPRTTLTIDRLHQLGVRLSLDDFGTGYSSLGYLRRLPVSELKVDQSFVKNMVLDEQDAVIVRSTIDLGHNLGLQVVAEGIENSRTHEMLISLGCDIGQGYGIARPLAPELFDTWLQTTEYALPTPVFTDLS